VSDAPLLEVRGVTKSFGGTAALSDVSLLAGAGEVHAVLGENGAGKSTLMKVLAGAHRPDGGTVMLGGEPFVPNEPREARARGVAIVYQEPQLCPDLSVAENIVLGLEPTRRGFVDRTAMRARAGAALALLGTDHGIELDTRAGDLPPGEVQLMSIARALAQAEVRVLILDEPTASLGSREVELLFAAVRTLVKRGIAVLYISHFLEEVEQIAQRYTVLRDGRTVGSGVIGETPMAEVVRLMVGRDVGEAAPRAKREPGELVLSLAELGGDDKPVSASLSLRRGEVLGIAGLVGSGRTELLRAIFGLDAVRRGTIKVGAVAGPASPARRLEQGVGMLSEDRKGEGLAQALDIADNLTLSHLGGFGPAGFVLPGRQRATARRWIEKLRVRCRDPHQPIGELSGGNQQKVAIARLLHHGVDVLLLDEPTRGIDVLSRAEVHKLIDELAAQGKAVLVVSSYLPELFAICDRIAVMRRGRLGEAHAIGEVDAHTLLVEATGA
jgi:ribose transport system ATP-binding protein